MDPANDEAKSFAVMVAQGAASGLLAGPMNRGDTLLNTIHGHESFSALSHPTEEKS